MLKKRLGKRLGRLSNSEKLLIDRLRRNETQLQAADRYDMTEFLYGQIERGHTEEHCIKGPSLGSLADHERCLIYRRRSGLTQAELAVKVSRSRHWIILMEQGVKGCTELVVYWEK